MFGSQIVEVAIGLILMYLLLSLICSSIREGLESWQKLRAVDLERGIRGLLNDEAGQGLARDLYNHPLVYGLFQGTYDPERTRKNLPSYIPARNFSLALLDIVARGPSVSTTPAATAAASIDNRVSLASLRAAAAKLENAAVQRALLTAIDTANNDLAAAQANVEAWFNSAMDRVSGWYKRRTQKIIFAVGLLLTVAVNADTLTVAESVVRDEALRKAIVAEAETVARDPRSRAADVQTRYQEIKSLGFPIGWGQITRALAASAPVTCTSGCLLQDIGRVLWEIAGHVPGWLMTALAISLGAPFWFDVLNKFMVIRSTVKPHEKSPEEGSEDRPASSTQSTVVAPGS
jgi:hypothetical protein